MLTPAYRSRLLGSVGNLAALGVLGQIGQFEDRPDFDYYIDSVGGSDSNAGTSEASAFASGDPVPWANNVRVGVKRGSSFTAPLVDNESLTGVTVGTYGSGARPVIDLSATLSAGGWTLKGGTSHTYQRSVVLASAVGLVYLTMQEDGTLLKRQTTEGAVESGAGSFHATADEGTVTISYNPSSNDDPASNGKVVTYSAEEVAVRLGANSSVSGLYAKNNRAQSGSIVVRDTSRLIDCKMENGGKHNGFVGYGSVVESCEFVEGYKHDEAGIMLIVYSSGSVTGLPDTYIQRNTFTSIGRLGTPANCVYGHTSGGNGGTNIYTRYNAFMDVFGAAYVSPANIAGEDYFEYNYLTISDGYTTLPTVSTKFGDPYITPGKYFRYNKIWFPEPWATTFVAATKLIESNHTLEVDDNEIYCGPYFTYAAMATSGTPVLTFRRNLGTTLGSAIIRLQVNGSSVTASGNVFGIAAGKPIDITGTSASVTSDNNSWPGASDFRKNNTTYSWANWVAQGHDAASDAAGDNRAASRYQGQAVTSAIAEWPHCVFHIDAQTTASITQSAGAISAVADIGQGGRNFILHEPTPGTDKVLLSTVGGYPYFEPVAAGGLKISSLDRSAQVHMLAAVVRFTSSVSAGSTGQVLLSGQTNDSQRVIFGAISAGFTNEIFGAYTSSGSAGVAYTHASDTISSGVPHLFVLYFDPVQNLCFLEIDGGSPISLTAVSVAQAWLIDMGKSQTIMLMRRNSSTQTLGGYLGEIAAFGPASLAAKTAITSTMKARWGIA